MRIFRAHFHSKGAKNSVADPHHFYADPAFQFDADPDTDPTRHLDGDPDPDPTFYFDADLDPDPDPDSAFLMRIRVCRPSMAPG